MVQGNLIKTVLWLQKISLILINFLVKTWQDSEEKQSKKNPEWVVLDCIQILRELIQTNKYVALTADVMYVNS